MGLQEWPIWRRSHVVPDFDGHPDNLIKAGRFHRAKGLEFKVVFLLGLSEGQFPEPRKRLESSYDERQALQIGEW